MFGLKIFGMILLCAALSFGVDSLSISGTVTKTEGSSGLKDALVTTTFFRGNDESVKTNTDSLGKFLLYKHNTSAKETPGMSHAIALPFALKNNAIVFLPSLGSVSGKLDIFSADGKNSFSLSFHGLKAGKQGITLPRLVGGINVMRIALNNNLFVQKLVCVGNSVYSQDGFSFVQKAGEALMAKCQSLPDTLLVYKKNYIDTRLPLDSYTKKNLSLSMSLGVLKTMFQLSDTMIPQWKMKYASVDSSFTLWSASDLNDDIDGGYDEYTSRGMLQAADMQMVGPVNSEGDHYLLYWASFVMDFGTEAKAKNMYDAHKENYYYPDEAVVIPGYDTSVAFGEPGTGSLTVRAYYKNFYFKLELRKFPEPDTAIAKGKMFLDFFKSKIQ
jgi:hypothetical protein